jgi:hypothetical protein
MSATPTYDVYLSYSRDDAEIVGELQRRLGDSGLRVWRDEQMEPGSEWAQALASALASARFAAICIGPSGLARGQQREVDAAEARAANDPDFRFGAVLLPGVPADLSAAALPVQLARRQWIDLRSGFSNLSAWVGSLAATPEPTPVDATPPATASVEAAASRLTGDVTAAAFVAALLQLHPEYGERRGRSVVLDMESGKQAAAERWIENVRGLLNADDVTEIHGRLLIAGLARIDRDLREQLERDGFLGALEREIREPLATVFRDDPRPPEESVPTHMDNPATVDELNREGFARILARRIRDTRRHDVARSNHSRDVDVPPGSFLVQVHGPWGSGKTSLLNFLRDDLHNGETPPWVVVTFNAWQHQRLAPPWWWLMTALYHQGFHELWRISPRRALIFRGREWLWRVRGAWQGLLMLLGAAALLVVVWRAGFFHSLGKGKSFSLDTVKDVVVGTAALLTPLLAIWGVARTASRWLLTTSARGARAYIDHARDPMQTTKDHFAQLVEWLDYPLAIVIDDLDRCKPPFAVELLEGIQTLFRDVPVAYVVAADREWLARSYTAEYSSFEGAFDEPGRPLGYLFLEKTFQMTLPIPVMNEDTRDGYWKRLIRPVADDTGAGLKNAREIADRAFAMLPTEEAIREELTRNPGATAVEQRARLEAAAIQLASPKLEQAAEHVLHPFRPLLDANPRAMKRLVNAYGLARGIELLSRHTLGGDKQAQHRTALWTILSLRWPRLAEYLASHPDAAKSFGYREQAPQDVPAAFAPLFNHPQIEAVVFGRADGVAAKLDAESIRLCVSA